MRSTLLLALSACAPAAMDSASAGTPPFSADRLESATRLLTDLGPRASGTPGEAAAREALVAAFSARGLEEDHHRFSWSPWLRGSARLSVGDTVFPAQALSPSPTTQGLRAPLALAGDPVLEDHAALYRSSDGSRSSQFSDALFSGVAALIRVTDEEGHEGEPLVEVGHTLTGSALPAVAVDRATGDALAALAGQEVTLDLEATQLEDHVSTNVVGRVPGHDSDRPVFVTAHYDSWDNAEGAIDNALGVGMMLLLAERLSAGETPDHTVVFLATAGEEQGLTGAFRFVADVSEAARARFVLNLDLPWAHEGRFFVSGTDPGLQALALERAAALGLDPVDAGEPSPASDHLPFQMQGVPVAWHTRQPDRHYHTEEDTLDKLDLAEAIPALELNWALLQAVAFDAPRP